MTSTESETEEMTSVISRKSGNKKYFEENLHPEISGSEAFSEILDHVGGYGKWQWRMTVITASCGIFTSLHNIGAVFLAATPSFYCEIPELQFQNISVNSPLLQNYSFPWEISNDGTPNLDKCNYYDKNYSSIVESGIVVTDTLLVSNDNYNTTKCSSYVYDTSMFGETVVTEWDLVCDNRWLKSTAQASYMMGILTGAVLFSIISDHLGRRLSSLLAVVMFAICTITTAFSTSYAMFLAFRFILAGAGQGLFLVTFIFLMECVNVKGRTYCGIFFHMGFSIGFCILPGLAYACKDWRTLQLVCGVPTILLGAYYWLLPESPRWLMMQGRDEESLTILNDIAITNQKSLPPQKKLDYLIKIIQKEISNNRIEAAKQNKLKQLAKDLYSLVKTPNMRKRNLITFYGWFVVSMIYYGLSFSGATLKASVYLTVLLSGATEIPSVFVALFMLKYWGRKVSYVICMVLGGIAVISIAFVPSDLVWVNLTLSTFGKSTVSICFCIVFFFSPEMMPTNVRNLSIGMASFFARIGSGIAPFIVDLLGEVYYIIPSVIFGCLAIISGILSLMLPETKNTRLPETIEEIEAMPR